MKIPFYMIANTGAYRASEYVQKYPRHLVLVQQFDDEAFYDSMSIVKTNGGRIILDNGAYEDIILNDDKYMMCINILQPHVVVLPDILKVPSLDSRERSLSFVNELEYYSGYEGEYMYVPQGRTKDEVLTEYNWSLAHLADNYIIGIGMSYRLWGTEEGRHFENGRCQMLKDIMNLPAYSIRPIHILGGRWNTADLSVFNTSGNFVGLDSYKPCRSAQLSKRFTPVKSKLSHTDQRCPSEEALKRNVTEFCNLYGLEEK